MTKQKVVYIEYLRIIAVLAVIGIHVSAPFFNKYGKIDNTIWWFANLISSSSRFAVPLFVMISGSVLLGRDLPVRDFYVKRLKRVLLPLIFWSVFYLFIRVLDGGDLGKIFIYDFLLKGRVYPHLWYLTMYLCLILFVPYIDLCICGNKPTFRQLAVLIMLLFMFDGLNWLSLIVNQVGKLNLLWYRSFPLFFGYFIAGYLLKKYDLSKFLSGRVTAVFLIFMVVLNPILNYWSCDHLGIVKDYFILSNYSLLIIFVTLLIFYYFKKISSYLPRNRFVLLLSGSSFGIYLVHPFWLNLIRQHLPQYIDTYSFIFMPTQIITTFTVSFVSILLIKKIPLGKFIC